jgi:endoglucanase
MAQRFCGSFLAAPASRRGARVLLVCVMALVVPGCGSSTADPSCKGANCAPNASTPPDTVAMPNQPASETAGSAPATAPPGMTPPEGMSAPLPLADPGLMAPATPLAPLGTPVKADAPALLDLVVKFYGAQRSGDGANWLLAAGQAADPTRGASCHLNDGESMQLDLSGGWYDAGDHVKVTLSIAYASYVMLKAFDAFPEAFGDRNSQRYTGAPNGVPDVLDEARYATDYLVKAHISDTQLVGMVGNAQNDHRQWVSCLDQEALPVMQGGRPRPVNLQANADIAGITAASLAIMARLYRPFDAALADSYQSHALSIYQIGKNNQRGSNPGLYGQSGTAWMDEMLAGAAELYRLTNDSAYLADALVFNSGVENHGWAPNYSQSADFSRHSLYLAGAADAVSDYWRLDVESYEAKVSSNEYTAGFVYIDEWASLRYAAGAAFSAALYAQVTGDTAARELAVSQLNYIAGDNGYARSFVVGYGSDSPQHPHHRNSDTLGVLLSGALVGGPTQRVYNQGTGATAIQITAPGYEDRVDDYVGNEVALDYNAGLVGLAAFGVQQQRAATPAP